MSSEALDVLHEIAEMCPEFEVEAFIFVQSTLEYSLEYYGKPAMGAKKHLSGAELCEGFRLLALEQFGDMAGFTLKQWGLTKTRNIGEVVFKMIEYGVFSKQDKDTVDDFCDIYDFTEAFAVEEAFSEYEFPQLSAINKES